MKIKVIIYTAIIGILVGLVAWLYFYYLFVPSTKNLKIDNFNIKELSDSEKYYNDAEPLDLNSEDLQKDINTANGYSYIFKNHESTYNPVTASRMILDLINSYNKTQNKFYLEKAEVYTQEFLNSTTPYKNALFCTYRFDYTIGGTTNTLKNPWYSGMAQGRALSFLSGLYKITGKEEYRLAADKIFRGLQLTRQGKGKIWVSMVKKDGFYWIEEYPLDKPELVLNGFLYATFGLYDYYLMDKTETSKLYLQAALTTAKNEIPKYRRPGKVSKYGLKRGSYNPTYHRTVIKQMRYLFKITNDNFFKDTANIFEKDYK